LETTTAFYAKERSICVIDRTRKQGQIGRFDGDRTIYRRMSMCSARCLWGNGVMEGIQDIIEVGENDGGRAVEIAADPSDDGDAKVIDNQVEEIGERGVREVIGWRSA
jgi:hypothetical protein